MGIIYKSNSLVFTISRKGRVFTRGLHPSMIPRRRWTSDYCPNQALPLGRSSSASTVLELLYGNTVALLRIITGKERANLMGPFGMIGYVGQARETGPDYFLQVCATISLFLGFFNLLPIPLPLLDGGWVVIFLLERLRRKEFSPEQKSIAQMVGLGLLLLLLSCDLFDIGSGAAVISLAMRSEQDMTREREKSPWLDPNKRDGAVDDRAAGTAVAVAIRLTVSHFTGLNLCNHVSGNWSINGWSDGAGLRTVGSR